MIYTLDYSELQLDRLTDWVDRDQQLRIIHILYDDENTVEDRYIVIVDCDSKLYTLLLML